MSIATPDVTVTGYLSNTTGAPVVGSITFTLCNYGGAIPRIAGSNELAVLKLSTVSNIDGSWSITLYRNNVIVPADTYYQVQIRVPSLLNSPWENATLEQTLILNTAGTFDLSNLPAATPPAPNPPATLVIVPPATPSQPGGVKLPPSDTYYDYTLSTVAITGNYFDLSNIPATVYDIALYVPGQFTSTQLMLLLPLERTVTFATNMGSSVAACGTLSTSTVVFTLLKNGSSFGTVTFTSSSKVGTYSTTAVTFNSGVVLTITAQALTDTTFANLGLTMSGAG